MTPPSLHFLHRPALKFLGVMVLTATTSLVLGAEAKTTTIRIGTLPGLRYDLRRFDVRPGAQIELVLSNSDTMLHNLVIVKPGTRLEVVNAAGALGADALEKHFVPDSPHVLVATPVVASGESFTLRFTAPEAPGKYPFVCTYPGHGFIMHGTMQVTNTPGPAVPNEGPEAAPTGHSSHTGRATLRRTFMPEAGPACIAVHLPGGHSYCWDAGACCLRYAWTGGFTKPVYRQPDQLLGEVYYREGPGFPLRVGTSTTTPPAQIRFRGYGLDHSGVPEFEYEMDGIPVKERLEVRDGRLVRRFRIALHTGNTIWFSFDPSQAGQLDATGRREGDRFVFANEHAREFFITISPRKASGK